MMQFGVILPGGTARQQLDQAVLAERAGWDGVFVWEAACGGDAWSLFAAIAVSTSRLRLGTLLTPLPWRRPWKVASQVATLDQLSGGRAIVTIGIGAITTDLPRTGEAVERRVRAARLDEGIDLMRELWAGGTTHHGAHYVYECDRRDLGEVGRPVQERIPVWVFCAWPHPRSMRRALRCDGVVPEHRVDSPDATPEDSRAMRNWLAEHGARTDLDIVAEGETPTDDATAGRAHVAPWAEAGCTWWLETRWEMPHSAERMHEITAPLPPR
jgi:alkanesulfonate monooxygenase SsuD/methylene tetrahydromethanopterin reductase-like flavin-dependent oxidoreductase (luciferase family)